MACIICAFVVSPLMIICSISLSFYYRADAAKGPSGKQRGTSHYQHSSTASTDITEFSIATLEAALEYISTGGLRQQKFKNIMVNGNSKSKRKHPSFRFPSKSENVEPKFMLLRLVFELIDDEDIDTIKVLFFHCYE